LRSQQKLAMPSACSEPCADKKMVQNYIDEHGDDEMCSAPHLTQLVECITGLDPRIASYCAQSPFFQRYNMDCVQKKSGRGGRRLHLGGAKVDQFSDGSVSLDLESLDHTARMSLEAALSASGNGHSPVGLKDSRFVFNASNMDTTPTLLLSNFAASKSAHSRRLVPYGACDVSEDPQDTGVCFEFKIPQAGHAVQCRNACKVSLRGMAPLSPSDCGAQIARHCIMQLKFKLVPPYWSTGTSSSGWSFSMELGGQVPLLQLFGVPRVPIFGDVFLSGGVHYENRVSCPHIPYKIEGFASLRLTLGVDLAVFTVDVLQLVVTVQADPPARTAARTWYTRTDPRRRRWWADGRRRRATSRPHHQAASCQVLVHVKGEIALDIVIGGFRAWVRGSYGVSNHVLSMTIGGEYYVGWGSWQGAPNLPRSLLVTTLR